MDFLTIIKKMIHEKNYPNNSAPVITTALGTD